MSGDFKSSSLISHLKWQEWQGILKWNIHTVQMHFLQFCMPHWPWCSIYCWYKSISHSTKSEM